ncbi:MaoC/PaaZ C-terminal domain-containing protein [Sinorhizobium meliloti]|uniref:MaoC/PaaZ C-terminal domain-containing protein n=1 Tax=Rhizobium meliloti TaxID=382 RepID=UPI003F13C808
MDIGETFETESLDLSLAQIIEFEQLWDPQPFHPSDELGQPIRGVFGSGLQSLCALVKLGMESGFLSRNSIAGLGIDGLKFRNALRPGSVFAKFEVVDVRPTRKSPDRVVGRIRATLITKDGQEVITAELINLYSGEPKT